MQIILKEKQNIKIKWTKRNSNSEMEKVDKIAEKGREDEEEGMEHNSKTRYDKKN